MPNAGCLEEETHHILYQYRIGALLPQGGLRYNQAWVVSIRFQLKGLEASLCGPMPAANQEASR